MKSQKLYIGRKIKTIRTGTKLTQSAFAKSLGISTSYLNLIENNQRHVTATVLMALAERYAVDITSLSDHEPDRILADLIEATNDSVFDTARPSHLELRHVALNSPDFAKAFLAVHQSHQRMGEQIAELDSAIVRGGTTATPYEEVRDFFHYQDNYIHPLDMAGEALAKSLNAKKADQTPERLLEQLSKYLKTNHGISVLFGGDIDTKRGLRKYNPKTKKLSIHPLLPLETKTFQLAHQIAILEQSDAIAAISGAANFLSDTANNICKIGLANYFAGSVVLPYEAFFDAAKTHRHDLTYLAEIFSTSIEQVFHRLSTLQRPGRKGVPFFFARVDQAGNITKRHSATKLQFARFGAACPLWNVHTAFETPDRIIKQLAETPDGEKYICVAMAISKHSGRYTDPVRRYALALGCETSYASQLVYCDDLNLTSQNAYDRIGVSCRICERKNCHQRSLPPLNRTLHINPMERDIVPFGFE